MTSAGRRPLPRSPNVPASLKGVTYTVESTVCFESKIKVGSLHLRGSPALSVTSPLVAPYSVLPYTLPAGRGAQWRATGQVAPGLEGKAVPTPKQGTQRWQGGKCQVTARKGLSRGSNVPFWSTDHLTVFHPVGW